MQMERLAPAAGLQSAGGPVQSARVGIAEAFRAATSENGAAGLFRGYVPRLAKKSFSTTAVWVLYEQLSPALARLMAGPPAASSSS